MSIRDLLTTLEATGIAITVDGDDLTVKAPKGIITPELRATIATAKPELVAALKNQETEAPDRIDRLTESTDANGLHTHLTRLYALIREGCLAGLHSHLARTDAEIVRAIISAADPGQDPDVYHALCSEAGDAVMLAALLDEFRYQLGLLTTLDAEGAFRHAAALEVCLAHQQRPHA